LEDYRLAIDAGVDGIMHSCVDALDDDMVKRIADTGISLCPTLFLVECIMRGGEERFDQNLGYTRFVSKSHQKDWHKYGEAYAVSDERVPPISCGGMLKTKSAKEVQNTVRNLIKLRDAGVKIAFGSDAPYGCDQFGRPDDELKAMQRAGLSVLECLRAATTGSASILGCTDRGEIVKGKRADIIVVHSDMKENAGDIEQIRDVIIAGRLLEDDPARRSLLALKTASALAWGYIQAGLWFVARR
jgi:imidazolonepropionase-like amidohydrolase